MTRKKKWSREKIKMNEKKKEKIKTGKKKGKIRKKERHQERKEEKKLVNKGKKVRRREVSLRDGTRYNNLREYAKMHPKR